MAVTTRRCNTPKKRKFRDRIAAALRAATVGNTHGDDQEPYRCAVGHWHLRTVQKAHRPQGRTNP